MNAPSTFADLDLRPELLEAVTALGYEEPTPIQREAIPVLLSGRDLLGQAATGTGKTAAFALPLLQRMNVEEREGALGPMGLVLVPTRELAMQVSEAIHKYGKRLGARVVPIYGGQPIWRQFKALERGVDVVVATPGRAADHVGRGSLDLTGVDVVVLDEADEMLDMGFAEDIEAVLSSAPSERQSVLFSATMPSRIAKLAAAHLRSPERIEIERETVASGESPLVRQSAYVVPRPHRTAALGRILDVEEPTAALIFCRTRADVDELAESLNGRGYRAEPLHGGMNQQQRDKVMGRLRAGTAELLIATDVAARGLDIDQLSHVVNFDVPSSPEAYVHRIGRVGRAGREGVAITLAGPREHRMLKTIERVTGRPISVERLPTVADLRARRLELTRAALAESIAEDELDHFRVVVDALSDEHDVVDIALAAIKLAHEATGAGGDEEDIPDAPVERERRPPRENSPHRGRPRNEGTTRIFIGAGRTGGIRPQDLVGAITGESSLNGRDIGAIEMSDRFALVEVPEASVDEVIGALRGTTLKGKRPTIRREKFERR